MVDFARDAFVPIEQKLTPRSAQDVLADVESLRSWAKNQTTLLNRAVVTGISDKLQVGPELDNAALDAAKKKADELKARGAQVKVRDVRAIRDMIRQQLQAEYEAKSSGGRESLVEAVKGGGLFGPEHMALNEEQFSAYNNAQPYRLTEQQAFAQMIRAGKLSDDDLAKAPFGISKLSPEAQAEIKAAQLEEQWGRPDQAPTGLVGKAMASLGLINRPITGAAGGALREAQAAAPAVPDPRRTQGGMGLGEAIYDYLNSPILGVQPLDLAKKVFDGETEMIGHAVHGAATEAKDAMSGGVETAYTLSNVFGNASKPYDAPSLAAAKKEADAKKAAGETVKVAWVRQRAAEIKSQMVADNESLDFPVENPKTAGLFADLVTPGLPAGKVLGPAAKLAKKGASKALTKLPAKAKRATMYVPEALDAPEEVGDAMKVFKDRGKVDREAVHILREEQLSVLEKLEKTPEDKELVFKALNGELVADGTEAAQRAALPKNLQAAFDAGDKIRKAGASMTDELGIGTYFDDAGNMGDFKPRENYAPHLTREKMELPPGAPEADPFIKSARTDLKPGFTKKRDGGAAIERSPHKQFEAYLTQLERAAPRAKEMQELSKFAERKGLQITAEVPDAAAAATTARRAAAVKTRIEKGLASADESFRYATDRAVEAAKQLEKGGDLTKIAGLEKEIKTAREYANRVAVRKLGLEGALEKANQKALDAANVSEVAAAKVADFEKIRQAKEAITGSKWRYLDDADEEMLQRVRGNKSATMDTQTGKLNTKTLVPEYVYQRYRTLRTIVPESEGGVLQAWAHSGFARGIVRPIQRIYRLGVTMTNPAFNPLNYIGAHGLGFVAHGVRAFDPSLQGAAKSTAMLAALGQHGGPVTPFMKKFLASKYTLRNGKEVELQRVLGMLRESGIVNQGRMRLGLEGASSGLGDTIAKGVEKAARFGDKPGLALASPAVGAELIDDYQKSLVFLGALEDTTDDAVLKALAYTSKYAANYKRFDTPLDVFARDTFGFYSWMRFIGPHILNQFMEHPERLSRFVQLRGHLERNVSAKNPFFEDEPDYLKHRSITAPLPYQREAYQKYLKEGGFKPGSMAHTRMTIEDPLSMGVPFIGALEDLARKGGSKDKDVMRMLGPVAIALNEIITGHDFETDAPIPEDLLSRCKIAAYGFIEAPTARAKLMYQFLRENGKFAELMELKMSQKLQNDWGGLELGAAKFFGIETEGMRPPSLGVTRMFENNPFTTGVSKGTRAIQSGSGIKRYREHEAMQP